jgi:ankyrin repeat protein
MDPSMPLIQEILYNAIDKNNIYLIKLMMSFNINLNMKYHNRPLLSWAICYRCNEIAEIFLQHPNIDINLSDENGLTPFYFACSLGNNYMIKMLMNKSANPNIQTIGGCTGLINSIKQKHFSTAKLLLSYPNIDINLQTEKGGTALTFAIIYRNHDLISMLKSYKNYIDGLS